MWKDLPQGQREKYQTLITNFASLSQAFSQKAEEESESGEVKVAPIVNSKFQETVFQKAFGAVAEDIANTSYDASLVVDDKHKYLVGIKSFGIKSGDQKVAQFKKDSQRWTELLSDIKFYASISPDKQTADADNLERYDQLAREISTLRNQRIASSKAQIKGFQSDDVTVESVYHVLMPTAKGDEPKIHVGETSYLPIELERLEILGSTSVNNPTNFRFTDGNHIYKYTAADSQLHMTFNNKDIIVDTWDVTYVEDPFHIFENLHLIAQDKEENEVIQTVSWMIANKDNEVEPSSGFNGFNAGSKLSRKDHYREKRIASLLATHETTLSAKELAFIEKNLTDLLIPKYRTDQETAKMRQHRQAFMEELSQLGDSDLLADVTKLLYRDAKEVYIPIPDAKNFHQSFPDFFGKNIGTFKEGTSKLALAKDERIFTLKFLPSGDEIEAYINQDNGKAIQSTQKQSILGDWLLHGVFQLQEREPLTYDRLVALEINAIRLSKRKDGKIGIEFIWMDRDNPPKDAIGWVVTAQ